MADRSEYIEVHERVQQFYEKYPAGSLQTEYSWDERDGERWLVVKAWAYRDPDDTKPGVGHAWEQVPGRTPYTRGSELMVGETSAWGRALAALGIAVHRGIASAGEIRAAESRRIERETPDPTRDDPWTDRPSSSPPTNRKATGKQINYIVNLTRKMGQTDPADQLTLVNAALDLAMLPAVTSSAELTDAQARAVIDRLKTAADDVKSAKELLAKLEEGT